MEAAGLGIFMISACTFGTILEYPTAAPGRRKRNGTACLPTGSRRFGSGPFRA